MKLNTIHIKLLKNLKFGLWGFFQSHFPALVGTNLHVSLVCYKDNNSQLHDWQILFFASCKLCDGNILSAIYDVGRVIYPALFYSSVQCTSAPKYFGAPVHFTDEYNNAPISIIQGFDNPILTVMWLGFFHINASSGLLMWNNPAVRFRVIDRVRVRYRVRDVVRVEPSDSRPTIVGRRTRSHKAAGRSYEDTPTTTMHNRY